MFVGLTVFVGACARTKKVGSGSSEIKSSNGDEKWDGNILDKKNWKLDGEQISDRIRTIHIGSSEQSTSFSITRGGLEVVPHSKYRSSFRTCIFGARAREVSFSVSILDGNNNELERNETTDQSRCDTVEINFTSPTRKISVQILVETIPSANFRLYIGHKKTWIKLDQEFLDSMDSNFENCKISLDEGGGLKLENTSKNISFIYDSINANGEKVGQAINDIRWELANHYGRLYAYGSEIGQVNIREDHRQFNPSQLILLEPHFQGVEDSDVLRADRVRLVLNDLCQFYINYAIYNEQSKKIQKRVVENLVINHGFLVSSKQKALQHRQAIRQPFSSNQESETELNSENDKCSMQVKDGKIIFERSDDGSTKEINLSRLDPDASFANPKDAIRSVAFERAQHYGRFYAYGDSIGGYNIDKRLLHRRNSINLSEFHFDGVPVRGATPDNGNRAKDVQLILNDDCSFSLNFLRTSSNGIEYFQKSSPIITGFFTEPTNGDNDTGETEERFVECDNLEDDLARAICNKHNEYRRKTNEGLFDQPKPDPPLRDFVWDRKLADNIYETYGNTVEGFCKKWIRDGELTDHSEREERIESYKSSSESWKNIMGEGVGENVYRLSSYYEPWDRPEMVIHWLFEHETKSWFVGEEKKFTYDQDDPKCIERERDCWHYTMIVRQVPVGTDENFRPRVGCYWRTCPPPPDPNDNNPTPPFYPNYRYKLVCQYYPNNIKVPYIVDDVVVDDDVVDYDDVDQP